MKRAFIAAIIGCIIVFISGAFSHLVILIGTGLTPLPNEDKIIRTLETSIPKKGLYFFPGKDFRQSSAEQESAFDEKSGQALKGSSFIDQLAAIPFRQIS